jgi:oligoendopeptidase F
MSQSKSRDQIPEAYKWNLDVLYENDHLWQIDYETVKSAIPDYPSYKGSLGKSEQHFKRAIFFDLNLSRKIEKIYTYAHLKHDQDQSNQHYYGLYQKAVMLLTEAAELSSFLTPEILSIEESHIQAFIKDRELAEYRFYIETILRNRPHTRNEAEEELIAMSRKIAQTPAQVFRQLDDVDLDFGTVPYKGRSFPLTHGNFMTHLTHPDRQFRREVFFKYYQAYENHRHTIAAALAGSIQNDLFYAKAKRFDSCRNAALFADNVPEMVYDNLVQTVGNNLKPLFAYLRFRRQSLGLPSLHFYDTYMPLVKEIEFELPYDEAVQTCLNALAPLGSEYVDRLRQGFASRWVDCFENRGKRSGAYSSGCFDCPPYILMNYESGNINSLFTLIHEAGHSMHTDFANRHQPYVYHGYSIFVAEVASTFNEVLLSHHLYQKYEHEPAMRAYILTREIDNIRATLYRQTMFAEFELRTHKMAETGQPLTLDALTQLYAELITKYFSNTITVDDALHLECLRIPHFYSAFYVYKYATGISAAIALAKKVLDGDQGAVEKYHRFLMAGGSDYPLPLLKTAGVDLTQSEPVEEAISFFEDRVEQLRSLYPLLQQDSS